MAPQVPRIQGPRFDIEEGLPVEAGQERNGALGSLRGENPDGDAGLSFEPGCDPRLFQTGRQIGLKKDGGHGRTSRKRVPGRKVEIAKEWAPAECVPGIATTDLLGDGTTVDSNPPLGTSFLIIDRQGGDTLSAPYA
jgi:hypothetical protein